MRKQHIELERQRKRGTIYLERQTERGEGAS